MVNKKQHPPFCVKKCIKPLFAGKMPGYGMNADGLPDGSG
jgi:hypothetical protein